MEALSALWELLLYILLAASLVMLMISMLISFILRVLASLTAKLCVIAYRRIAHRPNRRPKNPLSLEAPPTLLSLEAPAESDPVSLAQVMRPTEVPVSSAISADPDEDPDASAEMSKSAS